MMITSNTKNILVIGGGLAGIAAAVRLAEYGQHVTLVETRQRLGGRATSFTDPSTGQLLDNCQHVLLGCCTNLLDLYRRLKVQHHVEWHTRLHFAFPQPTGSVDRWIIDTLESDDLPAPLHLAQSLWSFRGLSILEKIAVARGMWAVMQVGQQGRSSLHHLSFAAWLQAAGQPAGLIEKFWGPVVISAINELPETMAADVAIQVFQEGMLAHSRAYVMGLSAVPLVQLYDPTAAMLQNSGGTLMLSTSAQQLIYDSAQHRITGLAVDQDRRLRADAFVSALPFDRLAKIAPADLLAHDSRLHGLDQIRVSPIIGIHLSLKLLKISRS